MRRPNPPVLMGSRRAALATALAAFVVASLVGGTGAPPLGAQDQAVRTPPPPSAAPVVSTPEPTPEPTPTPVPAFVPDRVELPTLGISAPIIPVGLEPDGAMATPRSAHEIGWWQYVPVGHGNALLAGHRDWNRRPGSFARLGELQAGDPVVVHGEDQSLTFHVDWQVVVPWDHPTSELLGDVGAPVLTLITCDGRFNPRLGQSEDRVVVRAVLR